MKIAEKSIQMLEDFLFGTLGLTSTLTAIGVKEADFPLMAHKACGGNEIPGFRPLNQGDIEKIFHMCL